MNCTDQTKHIDSLIMTKRQTSGVVAVLLFALFMSFMTGYFLGTKHAAEEFVAQMHQEAFADQLLASVCALPEPVVSAELPIAVKPIPQLDAVQAVPVLSASLSDVASANLEVVLCPPKPLAKAGTKGEAIGGGWDEKTLHNTIPVDEMMYAAELIGFGTREAATQFITRVTHKTGIELELRARHSKHQKGNVVTWYQVVTKRYKHKNELDDLLKLIAKKETLHDINIVTCTSLS
jgi:hypothetical protein